SGAFSANHNGSASKITNLAAGTLAADSTDAVNGSQLFATNENVSQNTAGTVAGAERAFFVIPAQCIGTKIGDGRIDIRD
ncbi:hypothetical protein, partial [Salmonella enterica]|uniref:hypothetical protein n=1 Tax=Salmonella enterica TaxID=28901 RepID=UPI001F35ADBB